jgi:hypothetical protein
MMAHAVGGPAERVPPFESTRQSGWLGAAAEQASRLRRGCRAAPAIAQTFQLKRQYTVLPGRDIRPAANCLCRKRSARLGQRPLTCCTGGRFS